MLCTRGQSGDRSESSANTKRVKISLSESGGGTPRVKTKITLLKPNSISAGTALTPTIHLSVPLVRAPTLTAQNASPG